MKTIARSLGASCFLSFLWMSVSATAVSAQTGGGVIGAQRNDTAAPSIPSSPPADSNSLDISPQQIEPLPKAHIDEIPNESFYEQSESNDQENRTFATETSDDGRGAARLGVTVVSVQRAFDEVVANDSHPFCLSHRAPESFRPVRILVSGLEVVSVRPGSPAAQVGLRGRPAEDKSSQLVSWLLPDRSQKGDLIVAVNGAPVSSVRDLDHTVNTTATGDFLLLKVLRQGRDDGEPAETMVAVYPLE